MKVGVIGTIKEKLNRAKTPAGSITKRFQWRDCFDNLHFIDEMETSYLWFTFRMIWNHSMPAEAHVGGNTLVYKFGRHYTAEYMMEASKYILFELLRRRDMDQDWLDDLERMKRFFTCGTAPAALPK